MEEEEKQEPQKSDEAGPQRQHVHIFGAEVGAAGEHGGNGTDDKAASENKEGWHARKEEWKAKHREQREQWKMQRRDWHHDHHHDGGLFGGLVVLLVGALALLYTMGFVSPVFWHAIVPFWPILLILWGASIILGHHWFARFILFLLALAILALIVFYGLVRAGSPLVSSLSPTVVSAINNTNPH